MLSFTNDRSEYTLDTLNNNQVTELRIWEEIEVPSIIYCLKNLRRLSLLDTKITHISSDIKNLKNLQYLLIWYSWNLFSLPDEIGDLAQLQELTVDGSPRISYLPHTIRKLNQLRTLSIRYTGIRELPIQITDLYNLTKLSLEGNYGLLYLPRGMHRLNLLRDVELLKSEWSSFNELQDISNLQSLKISSCFLNEYPTVLSNLSSLKKLDLSKNNLTSLPISISKLKGLNELVLDSNNFTKIPRELTLLKNLTKLRLSQNSFLTDITGIGSIQKLKCLDLSFCSLSSLPGSEILKLSGSLQVMQLRGNNLTSLPPEMVKMEQLTIVYLRGNPIWNATRTNIKNMFINNTKITFDFEAVSIGHPECHH
jgi:Leucine-rich repeat (LRR) protein